MCINNEERKATIGIVKVSKQLSKDRVAFTMIKRSLKPYEKHYLGRTQLLSGSLLHTLD